MSLRKIADYTITRELGRGGMGTVYQALSAEGTTVAVKTMVWPEAVDARARWNAIGRFQREARAARSLSHPNICQVLDFGADENSLFIVMEFRSGVLFCLFFIPVLMRLALSTKGDCIMSAVILTMLFLFMGPIGMVAVNLLRRHGKGDLTEQCNREAYCKQLFSIACEGETVV